MTPNPQNPSPGFPTQKRKTAGLSVLIALAATSGAYAQSTTTTTPPAPETVPAEETVMLETFEVRGQRGSAIKAIEVKRHDAQLVDSIVSEDIGKFPDNNVVESLQRLPGVQVTNYSRGQIATVHIRGLPDITTTLNGRNIFTTTGQSFSLQDMPASLLKQVDVMKTRSASHLESGLAGILDIQTFRPFDFAGRKIGIAAKATYHEQGEETDPNGSILISNRWKVGSEGKFGALINLSHITTSYRDQSVETGARFVFAPASGINAGGAVFTPYERVNTPPWGFNTTPAYPPGISRYWTAGLDAGLPYAAGSTFRQIAGYDGTASDALLDSQYTLAPDAIIQNDSVGETKRPAVNFALQYAPNSTSEYTFEAFYNRYDNENTTNLLFTQTWEWFNVNPADFTLYPGTNLIKTRTSPNGNVWTSADLSTGQTDLFNYALTGKWQITPDFSLKSEAVYQQSEFDGTFLAVRTRSGYWDQVSMTMDFNADDGVPSLRFNGWDTRNVSNWYLWNLYDNANHDEGDAWTLKEEGVLNVNWAGIKRLKFGGYYDVRTASTRNRSQARENLQDAFGSWNPVPMSTLPTGAIGSINGFFDGRADIPNTWLAVNTDYLGSNPDVFRTIWGLPTSGQLQMQEVWNVEETTLALYLQADQFNIDLAGHKLSGQFGARFVDISTEIAFGGNTANPSVTKVLPSASFSFEITKDFIARAAYGQTLRRPGFGDLNPTINYTGDLSNIGYGTASSGNPNLKPTESKNIDLSLEYYFDESSMVHLTGFRRDIDGLVVPFRRRITVNPPPVSGNPATDFILSQPDNASNGVLEGFEAGAKFYPKELPGFLQGFGVEGSFTYLSSEQDVPITSDSGAVIGSYRSEFYNVSNKSFSTTLAYERSRFSGRISYAWRSDFLAGNFDLAANPRLVYNRPERSVNAQFGFRLFDGFTLNIEATNLTDDIQKSYYGTGPNAEVLFNRNNWIVGRTYSVSARYSF